MFDSDEAQDALLVRMRDIEAAQPFCSHARENTVEVQPKIAGHKPFIGNIDTTNPRSRMVQVGCARGGDIVADQSETNYIQVPPQVGITANSEDCRRLPDGR